jgi:acyl-CoA synthetase (AMP-forming)/AMP-acid ligase II
MIPVLSKLNNYGRNGTNLHISGDDVGELLSGYKSLIDLIPDTESQAVIEPLSRERRPLTHKRLKQFVSEFDLVQYGIPIGTRVSLLLPNGPQLAVTVICLISKWCAAPINPTYTWQEIKAELISTQAKAIIIQAGAQANDAAIQAADSLGIGVLVITPNESIAGIFRISILRTVPVITEKGYKIADCFEGFKRYDHPETVLLLHTSGTSGNKKLVPYSLDMVVTGVGCIISSWNLTQDDVCLNMV